MIKLKQKQKNIIHILFAAVFWRALWQIIAVIVANSTFLPSPVSVAADFGKLFVKGFFWLSLWNSFYRIALSFLLAAVLAIGLAVLSYKFNIVKILFSPLISFLKAAPVVSFSMMLFIAFFSHRAFIAPVTGLLMVLPVLYASVLTGLENTDKKLLEMAKVYRVSAKNRAFYIYGSNVMPFFVSGCKSGLGLCWKAAVAAEVIGSVKNTIGGNMQSVQTFLRTSELLAWTAVIIALSIGFEKLFLFALKKLKKKIET
jgi:NitT/TauT family transport system permease protein